LKSIGCVVEGETVDLDGHPALREGDIDDRDQGAGGPHVVVGLEVGQARATQEAMQNALRVRGRAIAHDLR
jgi:hypothetical protein